MAKIKHIAIATKDPTETANFFREVFDLHVVGKVDNDIAEGYYLSDGSINLAVMRFKDDAVAREDWGHCTAASTISGSRWTTWPRRTPSSERRTRAHYPRLTRRLSRRWATGTEDETSSSVTVGQMAS